GRSLSGFFAECACEGKRATAAGGVPQCCACTKRKTIMIRYSKCSNILIDGTVFLEGWRRLTWFPSDASKAARDKYEASVVRQLDMVVSRWSGWAVLKEIADIGRSRGKEVRIVPYTREDQNERGDENAFARPLSG